MHRTLLTILLTTSLTTANCQQDSFPATLRRLFFDADITGDAGRLFDSLRMMPSLKHFTNNVAQWNLNTAVAMGSTDALSTYHTFTFFESPIPNLLFKKGVIDLLLGETSEKKRILDLTWRLIHSNYNQAVENFRVLTETFEKVSTLKKITKEKNGDIGAEFSYLSKSETRAWAVSLFLTKSVNKKKEYEIMLFLGNNLQPE
jgi:hypothetical protein